MNPEQLAKKARQAMVEGQIRPNKVTDTRIIEAMEKIDRTSFARSEQAGFAYVDEDLPLGDDHYLIEPVVLARLIQAADISASDMVLEVGASSGYGAAILSHLANTVVSVDQSESYVDWASQNLTTVGADNAVVLLADLKAGAADQGPYDVIVVSGAVEEVPAALFEQLADGGRLVAILREAGAAYGEARLFNKSEAGVASEGLFDAGTPMIILPTSNQGFKF